MSKPYHPPLAIGDRTYTFPHLEPFRMAVGCRNAGKDLQVHIRFTTHCFTTKYDADIHPAGEPVIRDSGGRPRTFCPIRYYLSERLPALILALNHPKATVMQTAEERNWLHSVTVDDPAGKYHIFFELRRAAPELRHLQDLNLVVESAYPQGAMLRTPAVRGSMGFVVLCGKVYKGEPIATRR
nr:hypothetical protein [uncultured Rhodopila sp.]